MSEIFLFLLTILPGWNMFYLHLLTGLISSDRYWRVAKKGKGKIIKGNFKRENSSKIWYLWNHYENPNKTRKIEFSKNVKN